MVFLVQPSFPESGVYLGPDGVEDYMRRWLAQWERITLEAERVDQVGDTVLAHARQRSRGKSSGIDTEARWFMVFTFRAGKILRIESVLDRDAAYDAAGLHG